MKEQPPNGFRALPGKARVYILGAFAAAPLAVAAATLFTPNPPLDPALLVLMLAVCTAGNLFEVFAPRDLHYSFQPNQVFFLWGAVLMPPWAIGLLAVACFIPGWRIQRYPWFKVVFNVANWAVAGLAAQGAVQLVGAFSPEASSLTTVIALFLGAIAFVLVNHLLIALAVSFAGEGSLKTTIRDIGDGMPLDTALTVTGACLAALWAAAPELVALAVGPTVLIYRALWVPMLAHKARTDPKTGLFNFEYFSSEFELALEEAKRSESPLSVVMVDLDHLRMVNNRCGHLAGDRLIRAVAEILTDLAGSDGLVGRFGGEEYALLLPDTPLAAARGVAEEARRRAEELRLRAEDDGPEDLTVTISAGMATFPEHGDTMSGLLSAADAALYDAKLGGRNRVRVALPPGARETLDAPVAARADAEVVPIAAADEDAEARPDDDVVDDPASVPVRPVAPPAEPDSEPSEVPIGELPTPQMAQAEPHPGSRPAARSARYVPWYAGALFAIAAAVAVIASPARIGDRPVLFGLLVTSVLLLNVVRIDIFERANISPAAVPVMVLAVLFGPAGPVFAEGVIALLGVFGRDRPEKYAFDFGALALAGAAAAGAASLVPDGGTSHLMLSAGLAGLTYYVVNMTLLSGVMGLNDGRSPIVAFREGLSWLWPHYLGFGLLAGVFVITEAEVGLWVFAIFGLPTVLLWVSQKQYLDRSRESVAELRRSHTELEAANRRLRMLLGENRDLLARMHRSYVSTITSLARTIEAKDPYTSGHTERVAELAMRVAERFGFDESQLRAVHVGAIIHDIGKIGVPDEILLKEGALSLPEFATMRQHPEIASYILADLELPPIVKQMVRSHHERFDGSGYPDGIAGEEIPLVARILTVVDALDAMTSDRPYRKALSLEGAKEEISAKAGTQFCPRVVEAVLEYLEEDTSVWPEAQPETALEQAGAA
jgi:diguanylate cyclase (GGDEF)-like protein/putative nucleotidyltransferase with HDIG domain